MKITIKADDSVIVQNEAPSSDYCGTEVYVNGSFDDNMKIYSIMELLTGTAASTPHTSGHIEIDLTSAGIGSLEIPLDVFQTTAGGEGTRHLVFSQASPENNFTAGFLDIAFESGYVITATMETGGEKVDLSEYINGSDFKAVFFIPNTALPLNVEHYDKEETT